jgi:hypothetical protein
MKKNIVEITKQEMLSLRNIVNSVCEVNIMDNNRRQDIVDSRMIFSKILRDRGYTFKIIGGYLRKDHSTIINLIKKSDTILAYDDYLMSRYIICKDTFYKEQGPMENVRTDMFLERKVVELNTKLDKMLIERQELLEFKNKYERVARIMDVVLDRTPNGRELFTERTIIQMFNDL